MAIDVVVDEVADNLEEIAEATRRINTNSVTFFLGGAAVGLAVGFYWGYKRNKEKIRAEAFKESEEEVAKIREIYQQKVMASAPKPSVEELIEEKGYDRPLPAPVPGVVEPGPVSAPPVVTYDGGKDKNENWDYQKEVLARTEGQPYILHQDEYMAKESEYSQVEYTYFAGDEVLTDEDGDPIAHFEMIIGEDTLKFGHGTDDIDVVFVRNDALELEMQIVRSPDRYDEHILGLDANDDDSDDSD